MTKVPYSYLSRQFENIDDLFENIKNFIPTGDFTLGKPVVEFENRFADLMGVKHAIGVGSGTDAIKLSLKALGVGYGDEVITAANTFIATVGAINEVGATPIFVDCDDTFCMDVSQLEKAITSKTKAIVPVHYTGYMTDMETLCNIAKKYDLPIVEDACQSIMAEFKGIKAGTWGISGAFSLHPLKNLNVWGDAGVIITNDDDFATKLKLLRNHGMSSRDEITILGYNSRLDSLQAIVGNWLIDQTVEISEKRISNAAYLDAGLSQIQEITLPPRHGHMRIVYHLYIVFAENRDGLYEYCQTNDIDCKIHYPIPLYQQPALQHLNNKAGDFPVTDRHVEKIISFPVDQHRSQEELDYIIATVKSFYDA